MPPQHPRSDIQDHACPSSSNPLTPNALQQVNAFEMRNHPTYPAVCAQHQKSCITHSPAVGQLRCNNRVRVICGYCVTQKRFRGPNSTTTSLHHFFNPSNEFERDCQQQWHFYAQLKLYATDQPARLKGLSITEGGLVARRNPDEQAARGGHLAMYTRLLDCCLSAV